MMSRLQKGLIAGFAATVAVSLLDIPNLFLNWFDPFQSVIAALIGMPDALAVGWVLHAVAGVLILGPLFAYLCPRLPTDTPETKGIVFAVERNPIPHLANGQDGFNGTTSIVPILLGAKGLNVPAHRFDDFAVLREHGPVCQVEGEIAVLMGPTRPKALVLTKALKGDRVGLIPF